MNAIKLIISPNGSVSNNIIMIRKFFNMIFISPDGLSLHIYTAIAFSAGKDFQQTDYLPLFNSNKFSLKFQYGNVENIRFTDLTDSLFGQRNLLNNIWGNCAILTGKDQVREVLEKNYSFNIEPNIEVPDQALHLSDSKKSGLYDTIVCEGSYVAWDADHYFTLSEKYESKGLEYLNWIKTEIRLNHSLINSKLEFSVKFEIPLEMKCYCPDYMWYTCIPEELTIDLSEAMVSIGDNPPRRNLMQRLADKTALQLREWIYDENIGRCKRYRLLFEGQHSALLDQKSHIFVKMAISPQRNKHGSRQFFIGLLIAFLLTYVSDWTRLNELQSKLFKVSTFLPFTYIADVLFPLCVILMYLTVIIPVARVTEDLKPHWQFIIKFCKILGIGAIVFGLLLFFIILPILKFSNTEIPDWSQSLIIACMLLGLCTAFIYIGIGWLWKKLDFYDYF